MTCICPLRFKELCGEEYGKLTGTQAKDRFKTLWAQKIQAEILFKVSKETEDVEEAEFSLEGEFVPFSQLVTYFGGKAPARRYRKACVAGGKSWWTRNKMAGVKLYRLVKKGEKQRQVVRKKVKACQQVAILVCLIRARGTRVTTKESRETTN